MQYASLGKRFVALVIDWLLLNVVIIGILDWILGLDSGLSWIIAFLVGVAYHAFFYTQNNGQTPGKSAMGIRVVNADGDPLTVVDAFLRYLGYYINSLLLMVGWLWAIPDAQNRGFHDIIAGTRVVDA